MLGSQSPWGCKESNMTERLNNNNTDAFEPAAIRIVFHATMFSNSSTLDLANLHFLDIWIFWPPGNLNLALQRASVTCSLFCKLVQIDIKSWPVWTLATSPWGFPKATHIPVWSLDWGQHASHEGPLERVVSKVP